MDAGVAAAQTAAALYAREQIRALASLRGSYVPQPNALRPPPPTLEVPEEALAAARAARGAGNDVPLAFNLSLRVPSAVALIASDEDESGGRTGAHAASLDAGDDGDATEREGGDSRQNVVAPSLSAADRDAAIAAARLETRRLDDARLAARGLPTATEQQQRRSGKESPRASRSATIDDTFVPIDLSGVRVQNGDAQSPGDVLESKLADESPGALLGAFVGGGVTVSGASLVDGGVGGGATPPVTVSAQQQPSALIDASGRRVGMTSGSSDFRMEAASDAHGGLAARDNPSYGALGGSGIPVESRASADGTVIATPAALRFGLVSVSTEGTKTLAFSIINRGDEPLRARLSDRALLGAHARDGNSVRARHDGGPIGACVSRHARDPRNALCEMSALTPLPPPSTFAAAKFVISP